MDRPAPAQDGDEYAEGGHAGRTQADYWVLKEVHLNMRFPESKKRRKLILTVLQSDVAFDPGVAL